MSDGTVPVIVIVMVFGGLIAGMIAYSKNRTNGTFVGYFIFGALFPIIGIVVAALSKAPVPPPQPPGWYGDPWAQAPLRWYDGAQWTYHTADQ